MREQRTGHLRRLELCLDCRRALGYQRRKGDGTGIQKQWIESNRHRHPRSNGFAHERRRGKFPVLYSLDRNYRKAGNIPADFNPLDFSRFGYEGVQHYEPTPCDATKWERNVSHSKSLCRLERRLWS